MNNLFNRQLRVFWWIAPLLAFGTSTVWAQGSPVSVPYADHPLLTNPILTEVVASENKTYMTCPVTTFLEMLEELEALVAEQNGMEFDHRHAVREVRVARIYDQRECDSLRAEVIYVQQILEELLTVEGCTDPTACNYNPAANLDDESCIAPTSWYTDSDGDGFGDPETEVSACSQPEGQISTGGDNCDDLAACNYNDAENPTCVYGTDWYADADGDGLGDSGDSQNACSQPEGYVADDTDNCDDLTACNYDSEGNAPCIYGYSWYADADGDGLGDVATDSTACNQPTGYVSDDTDNCDDLAACNYNDVANPTCEYGLMWYADVDGDGLGDAAADSTACTQPTGFVSNDTDACDDTTACNYADALNPACVYGFTWYADLDGDGLGDAAADSTACTQPEGYISDDTDACDDTTACNYDDALNPSCTYGLTWYVDLDSDGFGDLATDSVSCTQPAGYVADDTDNCDDLTACNYADVANPTCTYPTTWYADADGDGMGDNADSTSSCTQPEGYVDNDDDACDDLSATNYDDVSNVPCVFAASACSVESVTYDGYTYPVIGIGSQCWFAVNLQTDQYRNGDPIPSGLDNATWSTTTEGATAIYDEGGANEATNLQTYGRLYNFRAAMDSRGICPTGWSVPTRADWDTLVAPWVDADVAGLNLKASASDSTAWDGTNSVGFTIVPHGYRHSDGGFGAQGADATYWALTLENGALNYLEFYSGLNGFWDGTNNSGFGFAIRCIEADNMIIAGCMDPNALNYDATATTDDGTCAYCHPTVDFDGYTYNVVQIGQQCWFDENLKTTQFANGDPIPSGLDATAWSTTTSPASTVKDEGGATAASNLADFGRLYNWYAASDARGLCPTGWKVPHDSDWFELSDSLVLFNYGTYDLMSSSTDSPSWYGYNASGWDGLPGGRRNSSGSFVDADKAYFWARSTEDEYTVSYANAREMRFGIQTFGDFQYNVREGQSIRCMRTAGATGCMDETACNYDPAFTIDGGNCTYGDTWYLDSDGDGMGDVHNSIQACGYTPGYVKNSLDNCDDTSALNYADFSNPTCEYPITCGVSTVTYDGYEYHTVDINGQCWFVENLQTTIYKDGATIPTGYNPPGNWNNGLALGAMTYYGEGTLVEYATDSIISETGRLYNWYAVATNKLCPVGWVVPSRADFAALSTFLGGDAVAGQKLKASPTDDPSWDGTNTVGWMGLPGGLRQESDGFYSQGGTTGAYWTSQDNGGQAYYRWLNNYVSVNGFPENEYNKYMGLSVRCIYAPVP